MADNVHTAASLLLTEARLVARMRKAEREAHYLRVKGARGVDAVSDLVLVVNSVRDYERRSGDGVHGRE